MAFEEFFVFVKKHEMLDFSINIVSKIVFTDVNNRYFGHDKKIEKMYKFVLTNDI